MGKLSYGERKRKLLDIVDWEMKTAFLNAGTRMSWREAKQQAVKEIGQALQILFPPEEASE